ncbi:MAG: quinol dehydrogenase ferredoxin subunit NapH [Rhodocyclaceae bacterium]|nr:quinol dehydrogenase ferredoxin subunit NapH [Rhodocyclaceae bacterium]
MNVPTKKIIGRRIGQESVEAKGWLVAHKWLILRRISQATILLLFLAGPWFGLWIVKGNLNYSYTLNFLPLTDPYVLLQGVLTGLSPEKNALIGVAIVVAFYFLVGGRAYCSWVCPVNLVTDLAAWLRAKLGLRGGAHIGRQTRYWILAMTLALAIGTGTIAWEMVNPVSMLHRGLFFGVGMAWAVVLSVFLFDLFVSSRGWCGRLCPVGAFYSLLGKWSPLRISAAKREACNDCMDCYAVCPEPAVIRSPLKGGGRGSSPVVLSPNCTNCGRCIDVCSKDVFSFGGRSVNSSFEAMAGAAAPK